MLMSIPLRFLVSCLLAAGLTACGRGNDETPAKAVQVSIEGKPIDWESFDLNDKRLELVDGRKLEDYDLTHEGLAPAEIGIKNEAAAAPVYYWRMDKHVLQLSEEQGGPPFVGYELLALKGDLLYARRTSGDIVRFKLSPFKTTAPAP
jgi:hypothetical protein